MRGKFYTTYAPCHGQNLCDTNADTRSVAVANVLDLFQSRASEAGVCRGSDTPTMMWGILICISRLEKSNTYSHANCMQHVLRCWERQYDGSEYKKPLLRPGLRPGAAEGAYSAPANPLVGGEGLAVPFQRTPSPLSALRASPLLPPLQN